MAVASSKKDKLIEEAQRLVLRGQLDKAIKTYEQVLSLDSSAINQRQKLAELLVKAGRAEDARTEFETIGKHYTSNSFFLKAIAVYKQLQKLFPGDNTITLTLAGLNEKHGLVGNALAEYKQVYDYYEKASNMDEALKILDRMQNVDPQNINIKLKLAESYFQAGKKDESYAVFVRLASLLQERSDGAALSKLNARIQQLFPDKSAFMLEVLSGQVEEGNAASAVAGIQALLRNNPNDKRVWDLIVKAYRKLNQPQRLKVAYQHYLKFFPDELSPKRGLLELLVSMRDINEALALLERYEHDFIAAGAATDLVEIYKGLDGVDPINERLLNGLKRACEAAGDKGSAIALEPRLASFKALSGKTPGEKQSGPSQDQSVEPDRCCSDETGFIETQELAQDSVPGSELSGVVTGLEPAEDSPSLEQMVLSKQHVLDCPDEDEFEIEIEIDNDLGFDNVAVNCESTGALGDNWLDSVSAIFDSISISPGSVKFGSDQDMSDARSHYDLGVSFREMGLFDEAIYEFRQAAGDPVLKMKCLVLQGACLRDKGDVATAENLLRSLLKPGLSLEEIAQASAGRRVVLVSLLKPGLRLEDTLFVKYELALTCKLIGKDAEAAKLLAEIDAANPDFHDVRSRLEDAGTGSSLDFSDEDLQGFDLK